jgi:hypothetical protein
MKSPHTKNTLLKKRTSHRFKQFFLREYFFSQPRRNSILFSSTLRCFNFFATPQPTTDKQLNSLLLNLTGQCSLTRTTEARTGNSGFKKLAVQWLNQVQYFNQTFVQFDSFVLRNRQLLKPAKR